MHDINSGYTVAVLPTEDHPEPRPIMEYDELGDAERALVALRRAGRMFELPHCFEILGRETGFKGHREDGEEY